MSDGYKVNRKNRERFLMVYHDVMDSELLDKNELLVFLAILRFASWGEEKAAYPKIETLAKVSRLSERTVQRTLRTMNEKNIVQIESQYTDKGQTSNLYTLNDDPTLWREVKKSEKKAPVSTSTGRQTSEEEAETDDNLIYLLSENTISNTSCQDSAEYRDLNWIKERFDYQALVDNSSEADAEMLMDVIHDVLNCQDSILTINHSSVAKSQVVDNIMQLTVDDLEYCLVKFKSAKADVKNSKAYLRSMLYNAKTQQTAEFNNKVM
jgi:predicted transcriptional regulator